MVEVGKRWAGSVLKVRYGSSDNQGLYANKIIDFLVSLTSEKTFIVYSYKYQHEDGRVSYPLCFIFSSPVGEWTLWIVASMCCENENILYYGGEAEFLVLSYWFRCLRLDVFMPLVEARHYKTMALLETFFGREESLFTPSAHDKCFHLSSCTVFRG